MRRAQSRTILSTEGLLDHGTVYIAWASYCDTGPYHGWILGYDAASLQQVMVHNTTPDGGLGGIWQSGGGLSADSTGNIYALTGNGSFNADAGGKSFGNSFIKISPAGAILDWFTPFNWSFLNACSRFGGARAERGGNRGQGGRAQHRLLGRACSSHEQASSCAMPGLR